MPRALDGQIVPIDETFAQRTASMHAGVVQGIELPVNIEYSDRAPADFDYYCLSGLEVGCVCDFYEVRHYYFL